MKRPRRIRVGLFLPSEAQGKMEALARLAGETPSELVEQLIEHAYAEWEDCKWKAVHPFPSKPKVRICK